MMFFRPLLTAAALFTVVASLATPPSASAYVLYAGARITSLGCHTQLRAPNEAISGTCFVRIDQNVSSTATMPCGGHDVRWDASTPAGRNMLSVLQGAFLTGKPVDFGIRDDACYGLQSNHPTFEFVYVN